MTFHVGQLVVCVDAIGANASQRSLEPLIEGKIYRVLWAGSSRQGPSALQVQQSDIDANGCWKSWRFRPLNDAEGDAELIARIKSAKPQSIPAEPCLPSHAGLLGSAAGDTHVSGGTLPTAWAEAREDSGEKFTNSNSHGEAF